MKKNVLTVGMLCAFLSVSAEILQNDSLRSVNLDDVAVYATRASETTPVAFTNVSQEEIKKVNLGQDLPYLLSMTPSALTTSDAGAGIGYTTLRIRGVDATRINVTANGIPVNDAESHSVFWVNLPDLASSVKDIQVQRGAGTSTNGAGAFGASVNLQTGAASLQPYAAVDASFGSFGTHKETVKVGTGLLGNHWSFDARLSNISTDGYIERAAVDLKSYFLQAGYYNGSTSLKLINFAGKERTYHAWNYASKEEMAEYGRRYNSCGYMFTDAQGKAHYYEDQTDNYVQNNWQLLFNQEFSPEWNLNIALHYTKGDGYYQEYKDNRKLIEYGLEAGRSNLVRKKAMDNSFGGGVFALTYQQECVDATLGGALNRYDGGHFGRVLWVEHYAGGLNPDHEYYRNHAMKWDGNVYAKADVLLAKGLNAYADLQYRRIDYKILGQNDKWNAATGALQHLDIDEVFNFFNPKLGLSWQMNRSNRLFGSFSVAQKEPTRNNYTDGKLLDHPKPEKMLDYELGYTFANKHLQAGANLYYMDYTDQLVLTGELNEIGEPIADNVADSYRAGVELMAKWTLGGFTWDINTTLSRNRVKDFVEVLYDDNTGEKWEIYRGDTRISFSPDFMLNNRFAYTYKGLDLALQTQYVGKQYMSNAQREEHLLDAYCVSHLSLSYTFEESMLEKIVPGVKAVKVGCTVYNLFNEEYENNGYASAGYYTENGEKIRYDYAGYAAQAGTNFLANLSLSF